MMMNNNKIHFILECLAHLELEGVMKNGEDIEILKNIILSSYNKLMGYIINAGSIKTNYDVTPKFIIDFEFENIIDKWCISMYDKIDDVLPQEN